MSCSIQAGKSVDTIDLDSEENSQGENISNSSLLTEEQPPTKKCKLKANQIEEQQKLKTELLQKAVNAVSVPPGYHKETSEKTTGNRFGSYVAQKLDGFSSHGRAFAEKGYLMYYLKWNLKNTSMNKGHISLIMTEQTLKVKIHMLVMVII